MLLISFGFELFIFQWGEFVKERHDENWGYKHQEKLDKADCNPCENPSRGAELLENKEDQSQDGIGDDDVKAKSFYCVSKESFGCGLVEAEFFLDDKSGVETKGQADESVDCVENEKENQAGEDWVGGKGTGNGVDEIEATKEDKDNGEREE